MNVEPCCIREFVPNGRDRASFQAVVFWPGNVPEVVEGAAYRRGCAVFVRPAAQAYERNRQGAPVPVVSRWPSGAEDAIEREARRFFVSVMEGCG